MDKTRNTRKFTVAPDIIYSLIKAQAGTLAKSVGECVMNSIDAGAGEITISVTQHKLVISDNGRGLTTREEIEQCFEVFGFEHKETDRVFGCRSSFIARWQKMRRIFTNNFITLPCMGSRIILN